MTRHSKNSTASAVFTGHERDRLAEYGTQETRAGSDSFRPVDACNICLHLAKEPVLCGSGHLFCRQCILDSMLAQMDAVKAKQGQYEEWIRREEGHKLKEQEQQQKEKEERFLAAHSQTTPMKKVKLEGSKGTLASYWVPSMAPSGNKPVTHMEKPDTKIYCPLGKHSISLKKLVVPIQFTRTEDGAVCPLCQKLLKGGTELVALLPCGHVICKGCCCTDTCCPVCEGQVGSTVTLAKEGTGYAMAGGNLLVKKYNLAFQ